MSEQLVHADIAGSATNFRVVKIIEWPSQPDGQGGWLGRGEDFETDTGAGSTGLVHERLTG